MSRIVVGVDGSEHASQALRWALSEARLRGCPVLAVHAWESPYMPTADYGAAPFLIPVETIEENAERTLAEALVAVASETSGVELERRIVEGSAARVLTELAQMEDLVVVGSRGRGGFAGLLLGSTSQQCAQHARCPVVIVRHSR
jgi:nucleotide-binding universal stress UspA family protein